MLQTTWGRVNNLVPDSLMLIDDGSGAIVKVIGPTGPAANGRYVKVTGVSGIEKNGDSYSRVLRTRTSSDVKLIK